MTDLLTTYSLSDIIIIVIGLIVLVKGVWDLADFFISKYKLKFNKDYDALEKERVAEEKQEALEQHYKNCKSQYDETLEMYGNLENKIDGLIDTVNTKFKKTDEKIELLADSNVLDIKQSVVQAFHFFVEKQGWIDDFTLDILERRFAIYEAEGGNSYVKGLMTEIRQLPKYSPTEK